MKMISIQSAINSKLLNLYRACLRKYPSITYPFYLQHQSYLIRKNFKLKKGIICLTFDNDYIEDNKATQELLPLFKKYNIRATWAVIGSWVAKFPELHKQLINDGHELMNHSWSHPDNSQLRPNDLRKFSDISSIEVDEEIKKAHEYVLDALGYRMVGFRMPHFRKHPHVRIVLKKLNYLYTSNHFALNAPSFGAPYKTCEGWAEIPLSGIPRCPSRIFETYRLFRNPDGLYNDDKQFFNDFTQLVGLTKRYKLISTIYMDACDIVKFANPNFEQYLNYLTQRDILICTLSEVSKLILKDS